MLQIWQQRSDGKGAAEAGGIAGENFDVYERREDDNEEEEEEEEE